jgi:hypothetical protein
MVDKTIQKRIPLPLNLNLEKVKAVKEQIYAIPKVEGRAINILFKVILKGLISTSNLDRLLRILLPGRNRILEIKSALEWDALMSIKRNGTIQIRVTTPKNR